MADEQTSVSPRRRRSALIGVLVAAVLAAGLAVSGALAGGGGSGGDERVTQGAPAAEGHDGKGRKDGRGCRRRGGGGQEQGPQAGDPPV